MSLEHVPAAATHWSRPPREITVGAWLHTPLSLRPAEAALRRAILDRAGIALGADGVRRPGGDDWRRLLLGQVSAYAYAKYLNAEVQLLATPRRQVFGSAGPFDSSALIVRQNDPLTGLEGLAGQRLAFGTNDRDSALRFSPLLAGVAKGRQFFAKVSRVATPLAGLKALRAGAVDAALIDGVALALLQRADPDQLAGVRVLSWSGRSPGAPLVTGRNTPAETVARLREAVEHVLGDDAFSEARGVMLISGVHHLRAPYYRAALHLEQIAADQGYAELRP